MVTEKKTTTTSYVDLTVEKVCEKINISLKSVNPKRISTLGLPGSVEQRVVSLNDSLCIFTRLRKLDLSRNALSTLAGLNKLELLEDLILYYNLVSNVDELKRLEKNSRLKVLDIRLNPVSKLDYRRTLLKLLPNLEILDDRLVSYPERKLADTVEPNDQTQHNEKLILPDNGRFSEILRCLNETTSPLQTNSISVSVNNSDTDDDPSPKPSINPDVQLLPENKELFPISDGDEVSKTASFIWNLFEYHCKSSVNVDQVRHLLQPLVLNELKRLINVSTKPKAETPLRAQEVSTPKKTTAYVEWGSQTDSSILNSSLIPLSEVENVKNLKEKLASSNSQVSCLKDLNKMTQMLQESHDALVRTNAHLVKELSELRDNRSKEIANYKKEIKRLMGRDVMETGSNSGDESEI